LKDTCFSLKGTGFSLKDTCFSLKGTGFTGCGKTPQGSYFFFTWDWV
jgi:hypothetical protein